MDLCLVVVRSKKHVVQEVQTLLELNVMMAALLLLLDQELVPIMEVLIIGNVKIETMNSIENEKLILQSDNKQIMLTNYRLRYHQTTSSNSDFNSIMLDKVSSIELTYDHKIWFLIIGILLTPVVIGIIMIIVYFITKKHVVYITPDGGQPIIFETSGMKREFLEDFIDKVEGAAIRLKYVKH